MATRKKTPLTRSLMAACSIVALSAVVYGCDSGPSQSELDAAEAAAAAAAAEAAAAADAQAKAEAEAAAAEERAKAAEEAAEEAAAMEDTADLEDTQAAAAAAATAAMASATSADTAASGAEEATATVASLQTGGTAAALAAEARKYANMAHAEYMKAKMASDDAAAAETGPEGEAAWRLAENAKDAAADAAMKAGMKAEAATKAATMELHIDGAMKWVDIVDEDGMVTGMSSLNALSGQVTSADGKMITGLLRGMEIERATAAVDGEAFVARTESGGKDTPYKQAVAAGMIDIGKVLDTSNDMARLTMIDSYQGSKTVRVFADAHSDGGSTNLLAGGTRASGSLLVNGAEAAPVGMYYRALHFAADGTTAEELTGTTLDYHDKVTVDNAEGIMIYKVTNPAATDNPPTPIYARRIQTITNASGGNPVHYYRIVDITADAAFDDFPADIADRIKDAQVTADIPVAAKYSHIHFGVWNTLGKAGAAGAQKVTDLGIGFVQSIGDGVTEKQGIGKATFNGDWVAAIHTMHSDAVAVDDGKATLVADFGEDTVEGTLTGLATLEGTLSGNGFSGTKATGIEHARLDSSGTFAGSFSGNIYGADGEEAAGVFSFSGGDAGAFRGAFGGIYTDDE